MGRQVLPFIWLVCRFVHPDFRLYGSWYTEPMSMKQTIESKLGEALSPSHLVVKDESHMHNVPDGAESHFNVFVVPTPSTESVLLLGTRPSTRCSKRSLLTHPCARTEDDHPCRVGGARGCSGLAAVPRGLEGGG